MNGDLTYDLHVSRWKVALLAAQALTSEPELLIRDERSWTTPQEFYEQELRNPK